MSQAHCSTGIYYHVIQHVIVPPGLFDYRRVMIALMIRLPPRNADDAREGKLT